MQRRAQTPSGAKPSEVTLDYFIKLASEELVVLNKDNTKSDPVSSISFKGKTNGIVLCCSYLHFTNSVASGKYSQLQTSVKSTLKAASSEIQGVPQAYLGYLHPETIAGTLLSVIVRLQKYARLHDYNIDSICQQLSHLVNKCPFLAVCMIYWARLKALQQVSGCGPFDCIGNEAALLTNYSNQIRGYTLDLLCKGLGQRLELRSGGQTEFYGRQEEEPEVLDMNSGQITYLLKGTELHDKSAATESTKLSTTTYQRRGILDRTEGESDGCCSCLNSSKIATGRVMSPMPALQPARQYGIDRMARKNHGTRFCKREDVEK